MNTHNQDHPFGSADWASDLEIRRAFRAKGGIPSGFHNGRMLIHSKQAGVLVVGGAGSGKLVLILSHIFMARGRGR